MNRIIKSAAEGYLEESLDLVENVSIIPMTLEHCDEENKK